MGAFSLSIAIMASTLSAISMLGISGESYIRGMSVVLMYVSSIFTMPLMIFCYLPVFLEMKVVSIYEVIARLLTWESRSINPIAWDASSILRGANTAQI